jgi:hypothetical protein
MDPILPKYTLMCMGRKADYQSDKAVVQKIKIFSLYFSISQFLTNP